MDNIKSELITPKAQTVGIKQKSKSQLQLKDTNKLKVKEQKTVYSGMSQSSWITIKTNRK